MNRPDPKLTSLQNDQVKNLVRLRNRRERDRQQVTLIEEPLVIARALSAGYPVGAVYYCPEILAAEHQPLLATLRRAATEGVVEVTAPIMAKISYRERSDGLLLTAPQRHHQLTDLATNDDRPPLFIVLESVEKPGNLGAVLRLADAAGAHGVMVCEQGTDLFNPNVLRASRGAFFAVPTVQCRRDELVAFLRSRQVCTVATSPTADTSWDHHDFTAATAIVLGTEHAGLSPDFLRDADCVLSLPMAGVGDSLNVAATAAILLYEAVRQRRDTT